MAKLEAHQKHLEKGLERAINHASDRTKNQPALILAAAGVSVTIIGGLITLGATGPMWRLEDAEQRIDRMSEVFVQHVIDGHPRRIEEKVITNKENIDRLRN